MYRSLNLAKKRWYTFWNKNKQNGVRRKWVSGNLLLFTIVLLHTTSYITLLLLNSNRPAKMLVNLKKYTKLAFVEIKAPQKFIQITNTYKSRACRHSNTYRFNTCGSLKNSFTCTWAEMKAGLHSFPFLLLTQRNKCVLTGKCALCTLGQSFLCQFYRNEWLWAKTLFKANCSFYQIMKVCIEFDTVKQVKPRKKGICVESCNVNILS